MASRRAGDLEANGQKLFCQADLFQNVQDVRMFGQMLHIQSVAHRVAKYQVFTDRGIHVVGRTVKAFNQVKQRRVISHMLA